MTTPQRRTLVATLVALAVASSWTGVFNGFTYDDRPMVLENTVVHHLGNWWHLFGMPYWPVALGGDGYRPLTLLAFAAEWVVGRGQPWVFHAASIVLYASVTVAVFTLAETCLPWAAAWVAAAVFAVHPVHVEAVAYIVGQSELLVALFILLATNVYVRRRNAHRLDAAATCTIAALYALACLTKEHGLMLPAILLAAELTIVVDARPWPARIATVRPLVLVSALVAVAYTGAHVTVHGALLSGFHPYVPFAGLHIGAAGRVFTMVGLFPEWCRLLLWPMRLVAEYGPPAYPVVSGFQAYQIPGFVILAGTLGLIVIAWRREPVVSFGLAFMVAAILPTSNLIVPSGILIAERALFLPSVGLLIAGARVVPWLLARARTAASRTVAVVALQLVLLLGAWRSLVRTSDWKDNDTLFTRAIAVAPDVYRTHYMLGAWDMRQNRRAEGEREYLRAIALFDRDAGMFYTLGEQYMAAGMYAPAISVFRRALVIDSTRIDARVRLAVSLAELGHWPEAKREATLALSENTHAVMAMLSIIRWASAASKHPGALDAGLAGVSFDSTGRVVNAQAPAPAVLPPRKRPL